MRTIGIKVLRKRLSEYVRLAQAGETILIADCDQVVAEIHPPGPRQTPALADAPLAEAVRRGWLTPPLLSWTSPPPSKPAAPLARILDELGTNRSAR